MNLLRELGWHLGARGVSALASSSVFALLARLNTPADAKSVFFFMFASGFLAAFLRSFCMFAAGLQGGQRRTERLRRVQAAARRYAVLSPLFAILCAGTLATQAVDAGLVVLASAVILAAGFDADLGRAALGRSAWFSPAFAIGSLASLGVLAAGKTGVPVGAWAVLCPWMVLASANLPLAWRLMRRRRQQARRPHDDGRAHWPAALLTAAYDGTVLNLPFLAGGGMAVAVGFDLSVASRLFSSAQPFFPLVMHWAGSGRLVGLARRAGLREAVLYGALLALSGLAASAIFVVLFMFIGRQPVSGAQFAMFAALLLAYCLFASTARFAASTLQPATRARHVAGWLVLYLLAWFGAGRWLGASAPAIVALQAGALAALAVGSVALARARSPDRSAE